MQTIGIPLLIHGEVTAADIGILISSDREERFIEQVMAPIRLQFPALKIVFEHITIKEAADYVLTGDAYLAATITPQHLMFNRNHMLVGVRPHLYCLPILKLNVHQQALRDAVASGCDRLFLGTDTAPHVRARKESNCGCAGVFNVPAALPAYTRRCSRKSMRWRISKHFVRLTGPRFYGLPLNEDFIMLHRENHRQPATIPLEDCNGETLVPFLADQTLKWMVVDESGQ